MVFNYAVFDFDMTLIDSIKPLMTSANLLAQKFGLKPVTYEEVYQAEKNVPNCTFELLWHQLWGTLDERWYPTYRDQLADEEYKVMELYPGGQETLETLKKRNIPMGLASNRDLPLRPISVMGINHYFSAVVGVKDVLKPKPAPDMILKILEILKAPAEKTLYICDSTGDIKAAEAAKVKTFSLSTGGHTKEELSALGAFKTGDHLIEVLDLFPNN
jgi:HAD superfamily hydrolase (TIGR01509 family)